MQNELNHDQHNRNDEADVVVVLLDDQPDHKDGSDQEQDGTDQGDDLLQAVVGQRKDVEDEDHNVDNDKNEVEAGGVAD